MGNPVFSIYSINQVLILNQESKPDYKINKIPTCHLSHY